MMFRMCYSKTRSHSDSYWNGFSSTLLLVLLVLFTCPTLAVDGVVQDDPNAVVADFYRRYSVTDEVDLVFVLDRSGSVSKDGWITMLNFVKKLLNHFTVDRDHVRVAVVTFSDNPVVEINDLEPGPATDNLTRCTVYRHLRQLLHVRLFGHTNTYSALDEASVILLNARQNAKKAVFLVTDSRSNIGEPPAKITSKFRSLSWNQSWNSSLLGPQVEIYSIGIAGASTDDLRSISELHLHSAYFPDFTAFDRFTRNLREARVQEQWIDADSDNCDQKCSQGNTKCMCGTSTGQFLCACPPGYELDNLRCKACQWGYYKEDHVPETCKPCPQNTTTSGVGASHSRDCHPLPGQQICPELPDVDHGFKFFVSGDRFEEVANTGLDCRNVRDGNTCHYECEDGFRLYNGSKVMKCNASGQWEGKIPYCKIIDCGPASEFLANKSRYTLTYANHTTTYNSVIFASCFPGLVPFGPTTWTCGEVGIWSDQSDLECKEVFCNPLKPVEFSEMVPPLCSNVKQPLGFECQMICKDGFRQIGPGNYSCSFETRAFWELRLGEEGNTSCRDIQAPDINCPDDITVELDLENCTTVDYRREAPRIYDNSGKATYRIIGEPANKTFCLGQALLTYEATDQTGNKGTCTRSVIVREKSGTVISCPDDIVLLANSSDRSHAVFWPEPIFHGRHGDPLPFNCSHREGTVLKSGVHNVVCYPTVPYQGSHCKFKVTISDPPCALPFPDRIPVNGNTTCNQQQTFHVKSCSTRCHDEFDMLDSGVQNFFCFWNGSWNLQQPWPECYRSRRPNRMITDNRIIATINSSCTEQKRQKVFDGFMRKVEIVLKDQQGPCRPPCECHIREVNFSCSAGPRSRQSENPVGGDPTSDPASTEQPIVSLSESPRENLTLHVVIEGVIRPVNRTVIVKSDQRQLYDVLGDVLWSLTDRINEGRFFWQADDLLVTAVDRVEDSSEFVGITCDSDQLKKTEENSFACLVCPVGTYFVNGSDDASAACFPCPLGFYKDQEGGQQCRPCGQNRNTTSPGARNVSECLDSCPPGYSSSTGYEPCSQCVQRTYQTESRSTSCLRCPLNQTTQSDGATSLDDCFETVSCVDHNRTCGPNGSCILRKGDFSCLCNAGFDGAECETDIDECENSHCQNHGTCIDRIAGYECHCTPSFTGERCELNVDECAAFPCRNRGSCLDNYGSYTCVCRLGFSGTNCQEDFNECISNPCINNGSCIDGANSFTCSCHDGFTGDRCEKQIDFCVHKTCFNGGTCEGSSSGTSCRCAKGYTGLECESEIDACSSNPCLNDGFCSKEKDSFHCRCPLGFIGETCSLAASSDFDLVFPESSVSNYVMMRLWLNGSSVLHELSICTWMRTADKMNYGTVWSYSVENNILGDRTNVLTAYDYGNLQFFVNGNGIKTNIALNDGAWHHLCFTWKGLTNQWAVYVNGSLKHSGQDLTTEPYIDANGFLVLGQEQDSIGGRFDAQESFVGEISQFTFFDTALEREAIRNITGAGCRAAIPGNVISWTNVLDNIKGNVIKQSTSWCTDVNECNFASSNVCLGNNTRCQDTKGSFECMPCKSSDCLSQDDHSQPCARSPCRNGGTCQPNGSDYDCICASEFTGQQCADAVVRFPCSPNPCQHGGSCDSLGGKSECWCVKPWVGRYCQTKFQTTCDALPCLNNGTCFPNETLGYYCECPPFNQSLGPVCEIITPCASSPCQSGGTCITVNNPSGYMCNCKPAFTGSHCEVEVIVSTTVSALCSNVDCKNGGTCVIVNGNYECKCNRDYKGAYCDVLRKSEVKAYHVVVKLDLDYNNRLPYNETFKETFRQEIHRLYDQELGTGRLHTQINSIREGSVLVDFDMTHSYYPEETNPSAERMKFILEEQLKKGQLGVYSATQEDFVFVTKEDVSTSSSSIYASVIVIVVILVVAVVSVLVWWYIKRYRPARNMRNKLCNPMRVSNPMYHGDFSSPSPLSDIQEDLYCEPRELLPYATSEDSDKDSDPGASCQNKRKKNNWHLRQSIPLPPKPDEAKASSFGGGRPTDDMNRATPPPPYYPSHGHGPDQAPLPPARDPPRHPTSSSSQHNYVNQPPKAADSCYFMPISDEEAELIKHPESVSDNQAFEMESAYLIPRQPVEEQENTESIEMTYLAPVRETLETTDEAASEITSDASKCNGSDVLYAIRSPSCDASVSDDAKGTPQEQTD